MANSQRGFAAMDEDKQREIASMGGHASTGKFGEMNGADPSVAGRAGAKKQPIEAKRRGGENSHRGTT